MNLVHGMIFVAIFLIILAILALPFVAIGTVIVLAVRQYRRAGRAAAPEKPE